MSHADKVKGYVEAIKADHLADIYRMTTENLDAYADALQELFDTDYFDVDSPLGKHFSKVETEQEQREYATSDDERVREAFGYGRRS